MMQPLPAPTTVGEMYLAAILAELQALRRDLAQRPQQPGDLVSEQPAADQIADLVVDVSALQIGGRRPGRKRTK